MQFSRDRREGRRDTVVVREFALGILLDGGETSVL